MYLLPNNLSSVAWGKSSEGTLPPGMLNFQPFSSMWGWT